MLDGWYCRSMATQQSLDLDQNDDNSDQEDDSQDNHISMQHNHDQIDYKGQYKTLKKKLKFLLYENEFFQGVLRSSQRRLLKVTRDRSFLLERLLQYDKSDLTTSESDETDLTSDDESKNDVPVKKRKVDTQMQQQQTGQIIKPGKSYIRRKKQSLPLPPPSSTSSSGQPKKNFIQISGPMSNIISADGHIMSAEEIERHLQSRQLLMKPERATPTVPNEMFSNEPSLDSESNDQLIETSPSNLGEDSLGVEMNIIHD